MTLVDWPIWLIRQIIYKKFLQLCMFMYWAIFAIDNNTLKSFVYLLLEFDPWKELSQISICVAVLHSETLKIKSICLSDPRWLGATYCKKTHLLCMHHSWTDFMNFHIFHLKKKKEIEFKKQAACSVAYKILVRLTPAMGAWLGDNDFCHRLGKLSHSTFFSGGSTKCLNFMINFLLHKQLLNIWNMITMTKLN